MAFILTKLDVSFDNEMEARQGLTDDRLRESLATLINVVKSAPEHQVSHAAIFPVTPFGFGNSVLIERPEDEDDRNYDFDEVSYELSEPAYRLREGSNFGAFNVPTLMVWSMLGGLWHQEVSQHADKLKLTASSLCDDLRKLKGWYVPIKGELV